ncbi:unnamed protein product [Rhizophagus irregularis]|nr:unnamed protein product [Rhizophagus irregularis]
MEEQNFELKVLMEYNSAEEFFDSDSEGTSNKSNKSCEVSESEISETLGSGTNSSEITIYVRHGVRIGGGGRVDKETCQILKRTYLCRQASTSCKVGCPWKLNIWAKKIKIILSFVVKQCPGEKDAGTLLKRLYDKKDEDPRWAITMKLDSATGSLTHLFWMTPEQQILWLHYHDWDTLSQNYPESKDYLNRSLGQNPQSWARAFTNKYFTASVQSTSRSEGENSNIKTAF